MTRGMKFTVLALVILLLTTGSAAAREAIDSGSQRRTGDVVRYGETARVPEDESVRSVTVFGADAVIAGRVRRDVVAMGGDIRLLPSARIEGNAVAMGGRLQAAPGAEVDGQRVSSPGFRFLRRTFRGGAPALLVLLLIFRLASLVVFLALAALTAALFPRALLYASRLLEVSPGPAFLWGIISFLLLVPLAVLFALTIIVLIGIVLFPLFLLFVLATYLFGYFAVSLWIGRRLVRSEREDTGILVLETLLGVVILGVIGFVPFFGGLVNLAGGIFGLGLALMTKFGTGSWGAAPPTPA